MSVQEKRPDPFFYQGKKKEIGVLLIHGFTGSTAELQPLGLHLWEQLAKNYQREKFR